MKLVLEHVGPKITSISRVQAEVVDLVEPMDGGELLIFDLDDRPDLIGISAWSHQVVDGELVEAEDVPLEPGEPSMPNLEPFQFWGAIRAIGEESNLRAWVAGTEDPVERAFLSATLDFTKWFEWDHPFINAAQAALDIGDDELRDLWLWAASVQI